MTRLKPWIITVLAAALTLSVVASVSAQGGAPPGPGSFPSPFLGTVTDPGGSAVSVNLPVEVYVGDQDQPCSANPAVTYRNAGETITRYFVVVQHSSVTTGCGNAGDDVRFKIGDRWANETGTFMGGGPQTLNLTLAALAPPAPTSVNIDVTVWRSVRTENIFVSTRPEGERWTTHNTPIDLTNLSGSGRFYQGLPVTVSVDVGGGESVNIDVTVWRSVRTGSIFVSTRPEGDRWTTHNTAIDLSNLSDSGRFYQGLPVTVEVELE